jgi:hypothetical protein
MSSATPVSSKLFDYVAKDKLFLSEMSTVAGNSKDFPFLKDNGGNVFFDMISTKTNAVKRFYLFAAEKDADGDVTCWKFVSRMANITLYVTIFND